MILPSLTSLILAEFWTIPSVTKQPAIVPNFEDLKVSRTSAWPIIPL